MTWILVVKATTPRSTITTLRDSDRCAAYQLPHKLSLLLRHHRHTHSSHIQYAARATHNTSTTTAKSTPTTDRTELVHRRIDAARHCAQPPLRSATAQHLSDRPAENRAVVSTSSEAPRHAPRTRRLTSMRTLHKHTCTPHITNGAAAHTTRAQRIRARLIPSSMQHIGSCVLALPPRRHASPYHIPCLASPYHIP